MKTTTQLLGAVSALALVVMSSAPALAEGTSAGSTITNNVSVTYDVGGVTQNAETASDSFTVDRRVNVNVNFVGTAATSVSKCASSAASARPPASEIRLASSCRWTELKRTALAIVCRWVKPLSGFISASPWRAGTSMK